MCSWKYCDGSEWLKHYKGLGELLINSDVFCLSLFNFKEKLKKSFQVTSSQEPCPEAPWTRSLLVLKGGRAPPCTARWCQVSKMLLRAGNSRCRAYRRALHCLIKGFCKADLK